MQTFQLKQSYTYVELSHTMTSKSRNFTSPGSPDDFAGSPVQYYHFLAEHAKVFELYLSGVKKSEKKEKSIPPMI